MGSVGSDSLPTMKFTSVIAAALIWTCQVSADWTGSGRLQCYGVVDTDVSSPAGGGYLERGNLRCTLEAWDYHSPNIPWAECNGDIWYQNNDMGAGYCVPNKGFQGCGYGDCVGTITCHGC